MEDLRQAINHAGHGPILLAFRHLPAYFSFERSNSIHATYGTSTLEYIKDNELLDLLKETMGKIGLSRFINLLKKINTDNKLELDWGTGMVDHRGRTLKRILSLVPIRDLDFVMLPPQGTTVYDLSAVDSLLNKVGKEHEEEADIFLRIS